MHESEVEPVGSGTLLQDVAVLRPQVIEYFEQNIVPTIRGANAGYESFDLLRGWQVSVAYEIVSCLFPVHSHMAPTKACWREKVAL